MKRKTLLCVAIGSMLVFGVGFWSVLQAQQSDQSEKFESYLVRQTFSNELESVNSQVSEKELDDVSTPIVDFQSDQSISENRRIKNSRYDGRGIVRQNSIPSGDVIVSSGEKIADFPFEDSSLVAEGVVIDSAAFLSNNKSGVYSEFVIKLTEIVTGRPYKPGDEITVTRFGGRIRYPNGQIVRYRESSHGSPTKGKRYLFFLKATSENDYRILTAYELRGNKIVALDGIKVKNIKNRGNVFDKHTGQDVQEFKREFGERLARGGRKND